MPFRSNDDTGFGRSAEIDEQITKRVVVSPNPFSDEIDISIPEGNARTLKIYDQLGNLVLDSTVEGESYKRLDMTSLANGIYYIQILVTDGSIDAQKIIKVRD